MSITISLFQMHIQLFHFGDFHLSEMIDKNTCDIFFLIVAKEEGSITEYFKSSVIRISLNVITKDSDCLIFVSVEGHSIHCLNTHLFEKSGEDN